jgi:hypothetical protein
MFLHDTGSVCAINSNDSGTVSVALFT